MAVNETAVFRVRTGGSNTNGGGYDPGISGAGTDYSQQDAAQLGPLTDIVCAASTTVTSVTGGFTSAMIGNAIWITGGGATAGAYFITARADTNTITVDRTPGTVTAGTGRVGGAWASPVVNMSSTHIQPGVTIYVRGAGSDYPTAVDYTLSTTVFNPAGSNQRPIRIIGENGRPMFGASGTENISGHNYYVENIVVRYTANTTNPCIRSTSSNHNVRIYNCAFDQDGYDTTVFGKAGGWAGSVMRCEFFSGRAKRTTNSNNGVLLSPTSNEHSFLVSDCVFHDLIGPAISDTGGFVLINNIIANNGGAGWTGTSTGFSVQGALVANTFSGNAGAGNIVLPEESLRRISVTNNIIANHGTAGIVFSATTWTSDQATKIAGMTIRRNLLYNNAAHASGFTLAADNTVDVNPGFVDASNTNFAPTTRLDGLVVVPMAGQMLPAPDVASVQYAYPGAIQPAVANVIATTRNYYLEAASYGA